MEDTQSSELAEELNQLKDEVNLIGLQIQELQNHKADLIQNIKRLENFLNDRSHQTDLTCWEKNQFLWTNQSMQILCDIFKLKEFRSLQLSAINIVLSGQDCLLIMSTGGGKSLCYQLPAILKKGITLVISPLISLIEDQIIQLKKLNINAVTLNQNSTKEEIDLIHNSLTDVNTDLRLIYVTPEKLAKSKRIMNRIEKSKNLGLLKLIAVDEVHCCSQWGHDFRPDYQFLGILKLQFKGVPILGLTATATANVVNDVKSILGIQGAHTLRTTSNRKNLFYEVRQKPASNNELIDELVNVLNNEFADQTGIIYCFSRKECEKLAQDLRKKGISAAFYHAFVEPSHRKCVHEKWLIGKYKVIVATLAFGMGIDKPDVRFVIHHTIAKSMENYYQESGRAGRDGNEAKCILYYKLSDFFRQSTSVCIKKTSLQNLYSMLSYCVQNSKCRRICIAKHFEETWDISWCNKMCDNCKTNQKSNNFDISSIILAIQKVVIEQEKLGQRSTANKILDAISKLNIGKELRRERLEEIIAKLIINGYLQEDFHFTPYSIISYILLTDKIRQLKNGSVILLNDISYSVNRSFCKRKKQSSSVGVLKKSKVENEKEENIKNNNREVVKID